MIATIINALTVIIGSAVGFFLRKGFPESIRKVVFVSAGLVTLVLGLSDAMKGEDLLLMIFALIIGGSLGTMLKIQENIQSLGDKIKSLFPTLEGDGFGRAFLDASLIFCVGALTILGSLEAGLDGNYEKLLIKSVLDGFMAVVLTSTLGVGVGFSAIFILLFQGGLTLAAGLIEPWMSPRVILGISSVGGVMIVMIALDLLDLKKIKTGNFLPALLIMVLLILTAPIWEQIDLNNLLPT